ncbi:MAG: methyl-accepting chemotaxis protein, partial [Treponema sp.]|nr:methyl-accepting chemotaxis protein [Treponema sp.]
MKIGLKLTMIMIILSLFSVGSVGVTMLVRSSSSLSSISEDYTYSRAHDSGLQVEMYLESYWDIIKTAAVFFEQYEEIGVNYRREYLNNSLVAMLRNNPGMLAAWTCWEPNILEGNDSEYANTPGSYPNGRFAPYWFRNGNRTELDLLVDFDKPGDGDYYLLARNTGKIQVLEPYYYEVGNQKILITSISAPIKASDGRVLGVVGVDISVDRIQYISQDEKYKPYDDAVTMVISNGGIIIGHYDTSRLGRKAIETEGDLVGDNMDDFLKAIKSGNNGGSENYSFINRYKTLGTDVKVITVPINIGDSDTPWSYVAGVMMNTVMKDRNDMMFLSIIIGVVIIVVVILISVLLSRTISKPLVELSVTLKDIAEGEGDLTHELKAGSKDEIGSVALYFNETLKKIKNMIVNIKKETTVLSDIGNDLSSDMNETAAAVNEINANVQSIKGRILSQSASVSETHATMDQVVTNINKLNGHVENQSNNISQASSAIEQMVANTRSV